MPKTVTVGAAICKSDCRRARVRHWSAKCLCSQAQLGADAGFGAGNEAGRVLLHPAAQGGLLGTMALAVDSGAIGRPLELPADGLRARPPEW